jgi:uncharacterized protein
VWGLTGQQNSPPDQPGEKIMDYMIWMEKSKQDVVKRALKKVAQDGLDAPHHFYITFRTQFPGVSIPLNLNQRYPEEMTIVLQDSFWNINVQDDYFTVDLMFDHKKSTLRIPFSSLCSFIDPSADFALQFDWNSVTPTFFADNVLSLDHFRALRQQ